MIVSERAPQLHRVVKNHEEQYSTWPTTRELPLGWIEAGVSGTREHCLEWIGVNWTDMRPLSVRRFEEQRQASSTNGTERGER